MSRFPVYCNTADIRTVGLAVGRDRFTVLLCCDTSIIMMSTSQKVAEVELAANCDGLWSFKLLSAASNCTFGMWPVKFPF
jgi:hypothetical protein